MRMTFPRSQGKQIFYDARKSNWGDLFPHTPKHSPVLRYTGSKPKASKDAPVNVDDSEDMKPDVPLTKEEEMAWNRLMGMEELGTKEKKGKRRIDKMLGGGRGGEGELSKATIMSQGRAGWGGVLESLKVKDQTRRRERKMERHAKDVGDADTD